MRLRAALACLIALLLVPSAASAQSVKVTDPSTGLPVFSSANPASVKSVSTGTSADHVQGNVAASASDTGTNPVKVGAIVETGQSAATGATTGQRGNMVVDGNGGLKALVAESVGATDATSNTSGLRVSGAWGYPLLTAGFVYNGTNWDRQRGDTNGAVFQRGLSTTFWSYTSGASPILSNTTTAVTIKTAAGASVKNFIDSCQITTTAFGVSVPLAIRDGAAGTVKWALTVPTAGFLQPVQIAFETPIPSTANTLLEVVTTTANTSGTVTLNCQGHTGS